MMSPLVRRRVRRHVERGAVAAIVAILFAGGALLGAAALSIDVGGLMEERSQLQNSADAAAMSLAQTCAEDLANCVATAPGTAALNNANSSDGVSAFDTSAYAHGICGRPSAPALASTALPACNPPTGKITDCTNLPSTLAANPAIPYIEVHNKTEIPGGSTLFPTPLIATLAGMPSGTSVAACSRAMWGNPGSYTASAPMTFSDCEWKAYTNGGTNYEARPVGTTGYPPGYGGGYPQPLAPSSEIVIYLQDHGGGNPCTTSNGHDTAGGFGFLDDSGNCTTTVQQGKWVQIKTGNLPCISTVLPGLRGKVIDLPVYDCMYTSTSGSPGFDPVPPGTPCYDTPGNNTWYHIAGWAEFYLSGYSLAGIQANSYLTNAPPCSSPDWCVSGWFVSGVLLASVSGPPGPPNYGTYAIAPAG